MKFCIAILLASLFTQPVAAESIRKLVEFKRGEISDLSITGINHGTSELYALAVANSESNLMVMVYSGVDPQVRSQTTLGRVSSVAVAPTRDNQFITAIRDGNGELRVISWRIAADGRNLERRDTVLGPAIREVKAAAANNGDVRLAGRLQNDRLFLLRLRTSPNGALTLADINTHTRIDMLDMAAGTNGAIAMRRSNGTLRVASLATGGQTGILRSEEIARGGAVSDLAIASVDVGTRGGWVTITSSNYLDLGGSITPRSCLGAPRVVPYGPIGRGKIIAWKPRDQQLSEPTRVAEHEFSGIEGLAHDVSIVDFDTGGRWFVTGHTGYDKPCSLKPRIEFHLWELNDDRIGKLATEELNGEYQDFVMTRIRTPANNNLKSRFVVAARDVRRDLKITVWEATR